MAQTLEDMDEVAAYVKNHNLGFPIPYTINGQQHSYMPDFIVRIDDGRGADDPLNLIVEVSGKATKTKRPRSPPPARSGFRPSTTPALGAAGRSLKSAIRGTRKTRSAAIWPRKWPESCRFRCSQRRIRRQRIERMSKKTGFVPPAGRMSTPKKYLRGDVGELGAVVAESDLDLHILRLLLHPALRCASKITTWPGSTVQPSGRCWMI